MSTGLPAHDLRQHVASRRSSSTARTCAPASHSASVSEPSPGPTSTTWSPGCTPASRTMCAAMLLSARKFWPSALLGRRPCSSSSALDLARRHRSTPNTRAAFARVSSAISLDVDAARRGERGADERHVRGLVRLAPVRHRREVRAVGLDEHPVGGRERGRGAHVVGRLERHDAAERQVAVAVERERAPRRDRR